MLRRVQGEWNVNMNRIQPGYSTGNGILIIERKQAVNERVDTGDTVTWSSVKVLWCYGILFRQLVTISVMDNHTDKDHSGTKLNMLEFGNAKSLLQFSFKDGRSIQWLLLKTLCIYKGTYERGCSKISKMMCDITYHRPVWCHIQQKCCKILQTITFNTIFLC